MRLCINMLIFAHNLGNWLIGGVRYVVRSSVGERGSFMYPVVFSALR